MATSFSQLCLQSQCWMELAALGEPCMLPDTRAGGRDASSRATLSFPWVFGGCVRWEWENLGAGAALGTL